MRLLFGLILFLAVFLGGVAIGANPRQTPETCIPAQVLVTDMEMGVLVIVGDRQICGRGLYMTAITGPSQLDSSRLPFR